MELIKPVAGQISDSPEVDSSNAPRIRVVATRIRGRTAIFDPTRTMMFDAVPDLGATRPHFLDRAVIVQFLSQEGRDRPGRRRRKFQKPYTTQLLPVGYLKGGRATDSE